jgi:hypothetical protein
MNVTELVETYVQLWNEPDAERRRRAVRELWAPGGRQVLLPPEDIRERAAALGFPAATLEVRGYADLDVRVERSYEEFIAPGEYAFRLRDAPVRVGDAVTFTWDMTPNAGGGREMLLLDVDGRILVDYQFIDG